MRATPMTETAAATARVLAVQNYPGDRMLLRLDTALAAAAGPGQMLRIDGVDWPILQRVPGTQALDCLGRGPAPPVGTHVPVVTLEGVAFDLTAATPRALLLADDAGLASGIFLARVLRNHQPRVKPFALFELTPPLPFQPQPSRTMVPGIPAEAIAALPLLEDWRIPSRIACPAGGQPGTFDGDLVELAQGWLAVLQGVADITVFACGGVALHSTAQTLAAAYRLPCQTRAIPPC